MQEEYASLQMNRTWTASSTTPPYGRKAIGSKWVFRTKPNPDGSTRFKVRLVIKGFEQIQGRDFDQTYAPVSKLTTLRYLLSLAAKHQWNIDHMDVVAAFLNPCIDRDDVYMALPEGMEWLDPSDSEIPIAVRLLKALYGLKQAPRLWYQEIHGFLTSLDFGQAHADMNLYIKEGVYVLLYVDDILILYCNNAATVAIATDLKKQLETRYKMSNLGPVKRFLGLEIERTPNGDITLGQRRYIDSVLKKFGLDKANGISTPMDTRIRLDQTDHAVTVDTELYLSIVGSLMYAALGTRPDIALAVAALSRYNSAPTTIHMTAAKRVLRYLKHTANMKLR